MNVVSDFKVALPARMTEIALADTFAGRHFQKLRYVATWGKWVVWDGHVWREDMSLAALDLARDLCREAGDLADTPKEKTTLQGARTVAAVERLARSDRR